MRFLPALLKSNSLNEHFDEMFDKPKVVKPDSFIVSNGPQWSESDGVHARVGRKTHNELKKLSEKG
jgi:hypothetical protein